MRQLEDPAALIARVRIALRFDEGRFPVRGIQARGAGTVAGLPAALTWWHYDDGRIRLEITSQLSEMSAYDGVRGTHVGPSGVLEPLDLADLDELRMTSALFTGAWLPRESRPARCG